jgi:hypothetical protein
VTEYGTCWCTRALCLLDNSAGAHQLKGNSLHLDILARGCVGHPWYPIFVFLRPQRRYKSFVGFVANDDVILSMWCKDDSQINIIYKYLSVYDMISHSSTGPCIFRPLLVHRPAWQAILPEAALADACHLQPLGCRCY